jgi:hypothetical protein
MMNLNFCASTGVWTDDNGNVIVPEGHSWSGNDSNPEVNPLKLHGKLNTGNITMPDGSVVPAQSLHKIGALPCGVYFVGEWGDWSTVAGYPKHLGPLIARLTQTSGETYGRDGMFIHGPASGPLYGQESEGCTVTLHADRQKVALLNPTTVTVTA